MGLDVGFEAGELSGGSFGDVISLMPSAISGLEYNDALSNLSLIHISEPTRPY